MLKNIVFIVCYLSLVTTTAFASELKGPAKFCGYSPIVDLKPGETIKVLHGGIHGGSFQWDGAFGIMAVYGVDSASRPEGRLVVEPTEERPGRFAQRKRDGKYVIAIWNGRQSAAYFESATRFTTQQRAAIDRVRLFQGGENPSDCDLRTNFVWTFEE